MRVAVVLALALGMGCSKLTTPKEDSGSGAQRVVPALSGLIFDDKSGLCFVVGESIPFTGKATWHYANGQTMQETEFVDGKEHGQERWWYEDGARAGQCSYRDGLLDGPCLHWHPDGDTKELQVVYRGGRRDGVELVWFANGKEKSSARFEQGKQEGESKGWFEDGTTAWVSNWKDGKEDGPNAEFYRNGNKKSERQFKAGQMTGIEKHWFENGAKGWESTWNENRREGVRVEWFDNGQKMAETTYRQGQRQGPSNGWYMDGNKAYEEVYQADELVRGTYWDQNGTVQPPDAVPAGLLRRWVSGEIEQYYMGATVEIILIAFGEPDTGGNGAWIYEKVMVGGLSQQLMLVFKKGKVTSIKVGK